MFLFSEIKSLFFLLSGGQLDNQKCLGPPRVAFADDTLQGKQDFSFYEIIFPPFSRNKINSAYNSGKSNFLTLRFCYLKVCKTCPENFKGSKFPVLLVLCVERWSLQQEEKWSNCQRPWNFLLVFPSFLFFFSWLMIEN